MRIDQVLRSGLFAMVVTILAGSPAVAQAEDGGPTEEGIEVHGHWIIEVYEGDELVERREFKNALMPGADSVLAIVLAGEQALSRWEIDLDFQNLPGSRDVRLSTDGVYPSIGGLTITTPNGGDNAGSIVFDWSGTPWVDPLDRGEDGQLIAVRTTIFTTDIIAGGFTRKEFTSPVTIAEDQTVNITVIISFTG